MNVAMNVVKNVAKNVAMNGIVMIGIGSACAFEVQFGSLQFSNPVFYGLCDYGSAFENLEHNGDHSKD